MGVTLRPFEASDHAWAVELNNAAVPAVSEVDEARLTHLSDQSHYFYIAEYDGKPSGLLLCFGPGADYDSMNYQWVCRTFDQFFYVDRIVVDQSVRSGGIGAALYDHAIGFARNAAAPRIVCEVNERPPNPGSMRFHNRFGFEIVGRQETDGGKKSVAYMSLEL